MIPECFQELYDSRICSSCDLAPVCEGKSKGYVDCKIEVSQLDYLKLMIKAQILKNSEIIEDFQKRFKRGHSISYMQFVKAKEQLTNEGYILVEEFGKVGISNIDLKLAQNLEQLGCPTSTVKI